jgi:hypothetical protein
VSTRPTWLLTVVAPTTGSLAISVLDRPRGNELQHFAFPLGQPLQLGGWLG